MHRKSDARLDKVGSRSTCEQFVNLLLYSNVSDKCWSVVCTPVLLKNVTVITTGLRTSNLVSLIFTA